MPRRMRRFRMAALTWAVLQFALPAMSLFADAASAAETGRSAVVHVEATTGCSTDAAHTPDCLTCHQLSSLVGWAPPGGAPLASTPHGTAAVLGRSRGRSGVSCPLPTSRAPPRS